MPRKTDIDTQSDDLENAPPLKRGYFLYLR